MWLPKILMEVNWTNVSSNWIDYSMTGYQYVFENWVYPIIFMGIIGYVYAINKSATSAAVVICLIFALFGTSGALVYTDIVPFRDFSIAIAGVALSALFVTIFASKYR